MSYLVPHIIHQLNFSLDLGQASDEDHTRLLEQLAALGNGLLPRLLDATLSTQVSQGDYQRLERLELELTIDSMDDLPKALQTQFPELLRKALGVQTATIRTETVQHPGRQTGPVAWLWYFLRYGMLPTSAPRRLKLKTLGEASREILEQSPSWRAQIRMLVRQNEDAFRRLLSQWGSEFLWLLLARESARSVSFSTFVEWQKEVNYGRITQQHIHAQFRFWQTQLAEQEASFTKEKLMNNELENNSSDPREAAAETEEKANSSFYIEDAGLVLLHPFMAKYLQALMLAQEEKLRDIEQAASVLYSLAWGQSPEAEWQLVLPKLLLGIPLTQVVAVREVTPAQFKLGEEMIEAAIAHWSVLGHTTVAGFRESFLQRPGRLDRTTEAWSIVLEQRPYDMLMEQLPWQMSFIKLPWMTEIIRTQL